MFIQRKKKINSDTDIDPEATELLFETQDVADLLAEATGEDVEVTADEDQVEFAVGDDVLTATPDGDEEVLEATSTKAKKPVAAATHKRANRRVVRKTNK